MTTAASSPRPTPLRLSFIVPAFNAEQTIDDTLRSILAQTVPCSAIVVDDGSTDRTASIVRALGDARVTLVRQRNAGLAAARNAGWREVRDPLVAFLDADDVVAPDFAERLLASIGDADGVACGWRMLDERGSDLGWETTLPAAALAPASIGEWNPLPIGAAVVRVDAVGARLGPDRAGSPFDESLPALEDWDLWRRLSACGWRWADPVPDPLFGYRLRPGSMSRSLETMHRTGRRILQRDGSVRGECDARARRWDVRWLARAAATEDTALVRALRASLGRLDDAELAVLGAELPPALSWADAVAPREADRRREVWTRRIERWLGTVEGFDVGSIRIGSAIPCDDSSWRALAMTVRRRVGSRVVVLYGMGRHGLALASQLERLLPRTRLAWCDDSPGARGPRGWPRLRPDLLTHQHAIIVTPAASAGIERTLRSLGLDRYETLRSLSPSPALDS